MTHGPQGHVLTMATLAISMAMLLPTKAAMRAARMFSDWLSVSRMLCHHSGMLLLPAVTSVTSVEAETKTMEKTEWLRIRIPQLRNMERQMILPKALKYRGVRDDVRAGNLPLRQEMDLMRLWRGTP